MNALIRQLRRWRFREVVIRLFWGGCVWLAVVAGVLFFACLVDFVYDLYADTPMWLRVPLTVGQVALAAGLAHYLLFRPLLRTPPLDAYAGRAEEAIPEFGHRLVTALQLNRPTANTAGMSPVLIAEVTREAGEMAARHRLTRLVNARPLKWGLLVVGPVALVAAAVTLWNPELVEVLLRRQALAGDLIPRRVHLANATRPLWPSGDEVLVRYEVRGRVRDGVTGTVKVQPDGMPPEYHTLTLEKTADDGTTTFAAKLPPGSVPFQFTAWLGDGRTRQPGRVEFAPRPTVSDVEARLILPAYLGRTPSGERYERPQPRGEVIALPGSAVRVKVTFPPADTARNAAAKPVAVANLIRTERLPDGRERDLPPRPMDLSDDRLVATDTFDLQPEENGSRPRLSGYRIEVADGNGFTNLNPPRRGIQFTPDEPPRVNLLQEVLKDPDPEIDRGPLDDYEVNGMPVPVGELVMIGYYAKSPMGIGDVYIRYRINDEKANDSDPDSEPVWHRQKLSRTVPGPNVGPFVPELGLFQRSGLFDGKGRPSQVELYPLPSPDQDTEPGELEAGGRYNFQTAGLTKQDGTKLQPGDRLEFYVEAFDKNPAAGRTPGRSESRIKTIVTLAQLEEWNRQRDQSRDRLRQIEERQRGVFQATKR